MARSAFVSALKKAYPSPLYEGKSGARTRLTYAKRVELFLGALLDQQVLAEGAWDAPRELRRRLGHLDPGRISRMSVDSLERVIRGHPDEKSLHRFPRRMATFIRGGSRILVSQYEGDPALLWRDGLSVPEVRRRLIEIPGISHKIANMFVRILIEYGYRFTGMRNLDIAVDRHVHRVLFRAGQLPRDSNRRTPAQVRLAAEDVARRLNPVCPGALDFPLFQIGRTWCVARGADCTGEEQDSRCPLYGVCPGDRAHLDLVV